MWSTGYCCIVCHLWDYVIFEPFLFLSRAIIFIHIEDVDRFAPTFDKPDYEVDMEEDRLYDPLMTLHAHDQDRSKEFKEICEYEIKNPNVPFTVDKNGRFVYNSLDFFLPGFLHICLVLHIWNNLNLYVSSECYAICLTYTYLFCCPLDGI